MAKVPNAVKILPKIWTAWVRRTSVADDRQQTDGRARVYSEVSSRSLIKSSKIETIILPDLLYLLEITDVNFRFWSD